MPEHINAAYPLARSKDLVTETIGTEIVVYDGVTKDAHCLAPVASAVFAAADGKTSIPQLAAIATEQLGEDVDVPTVELALAELEERGLLAATGSGISRRDALRRGALVGGAALAAPMVVSLATPEYGAAGSISSLSYVVLVFEKDGVWYRAKWQGGQVDVCGWGFATPGTDCTFSTGATKSEACIPGLSVVEQTTPSGTTSITVSWTDSDYTLEDLRIKCANECHMISNPDNSSPSGPHQGCP